MDEQPKIVDHTPVLEAARIDAGREGARYVTMTVQSLWQLIHQAPVAALERDRLAAEFNPQ